MTEVSQKAIEGILTTINNGLDKAPDYVVELVHRYSMFYTISNFFGALIGAICIIISIVIFKRYQKYYDNDCEVTMMTLGTILGLGGIIAFIACMIAGFEGIFVPEVVLLNKF